MSQLELEIELSEFRLTHIDLCLRVLPDDEETDPQPAGQNCTNLTLTLGQVDTLVNALTGDEQFVQVTTPLVGGGTQTADPAEPEEVDDQFDPDEESEADFLSNDDPEDEIIRRVAKRFSAKNKETQ